MSFIISLVLLASCVEPEDYPSTPRGNIEALWKVMDEHYCFFDYKKQQLGVDWNEVHGRYVAQASDKLTAYQTFELASAMLGELRDGHVNLFSAFDLGREWSWKERYPANFSDTLSRHYLGTDYRIAASLRYRILDDNTGYIYCPTFETLFGESNLDHVLYYLAPCKALILDVRNNSGGLVTAAERLASRFTDRELLVGYMQHKTGPGHNDFSAPSPQHLSPGKGILWAKPVVVLTNRAVYSAANEFVKYMRAIGKALPSTDDGRKRITILGDATGGGAGMPFSSELPNGWAVRFSACPMFDSDMHPTEHGIAPDHKVNQTQEDFLRNRDTLIEEARELLR